MVVIVGAGPVGLMLAAELRLADVPTVVLEQLPERSGQPRANGLVGQVVRLFHHRGLLDRAPGPAPAYMFGGMLLPLAGWDDSPLFVLPLPQWELEDRLETRAVELGADVRRGHRVVAFEQDDDGVDIEVSGPDGDYRLRAAFLVGCDGAHSTIRKAAGIDFVGVTDDRIVSRNAHVVLPPDWFVAGTGELNVPGIGRLRPFMFNRTDHGVFTFGSFQPGAHIVTAMEWDQPPVPDDEPVTIAEVRAAVARVLGVDVPMTAPEQPGRYVLRRLAGRNTRLADHYRVGRVLVAGDAAHVHNAVGGPGLNLGLQDVANLGWKLAAAVRGWAPEGLLDTYESERRPLAERVVMQTQAQAALLSPGGEITALRTLFGELLDDPANAHRVAKLLAGSDVHYRCGAGTHPLLGGWVPDFGLRVEGQPTRLSALARTGRALLLDFTGDPAIADIVAGWADRVDLVVAESDEAPADALLIRPDGYAAWVAGDGSLADALGDWFGLSVAAANLPA